MLREFDLPPRCLEDAEIKIPDRLGAPLLEVSADRSGVEAFGLLMAEARRLSNLGPLGLLVREQPTHAARDRGIRALRAATERGVAARDRGSRRRRRAARGAHRRPRGPGTAVDGARDRRRLPDAAHATRPGVATVARMLRARSARRSLRARARVRSQRGIRTRLQRHRVRARRPRPAEPQRRPRDGEVCAGSARSKPGRLRGRHVERRAGAGGDAARHRRPVRSSAWRSTWASTGARFTAASPASNRRFRAWSTQFGGNLPNAT